MTVDSKGNISIKTMTTSALPHSLYSICILLVLKEFPDPFSSPSTLRRESSPSGEHYQASTPTTRTNATTPILCDAILPQKQNETIRTAFTWAVYLEWERDTRVQMEDYLWRLVSGGA